jgi:predicted MFS family arabinose efflux permease
MAQPELARPPQPAARAEPRASAYSWYVLVVLTLVYLSNHADRLLLAVLIGPIKREFAASDTMMGLLAGPAFAIVYTVLGLPIARWADRGNRRSIIALGLAVWSAMTALAGVARSFAQLAIARVGVAVGEAAGSPPAHSLISDYFPPQTRGRALAIYAGAVHLAGPIGVMGGAWVAQHYGWRNTFLAFGIPGLLLALLVRTTIREPARGGMDPAPPAPLAALWPALRTLFAKRSYLWLNVGGILHALAGYGLGLWIFEFMIRVHGLSVQQATLRIGSLNLLCGILGVALGGWLTDRLSRVDARWFLWLPSLQAATAAPLAVLFLYLDRLELALICYAAHWVINASYNAPIYALMQAQADARSRAFAVAVHLSIVNLIGLTAGPSLVGYLNDALHPSYGAQAIRYSLMLVCISNAFAALFYLTGTRTVRADVSGVTR